MKSTLLITTFNRGNLLRNNLNRLTKITTTDDILIVDDGSSDNTRDIVNSFKDKLPIRYIYNHNPDWSICSLARNIGIKNTDSDIIITAEPEILFVSDVIRQMLDLHHDCPDHVISAGTMYHQGELNKLHGDMISNPVERLKSEVVEDYRKEVIGYDLFGYCKILNWVAPFTALYRKEWLLSVNGWDEEFEGAWGWEDTDLLTRLRIMGFNQKIDTEIQAVHQWHPRIDCRYKDHQQINANRFFSKNLNEGGKDNTFVIANKNHEWGIIRKRS